MGEGAPQDVARAQHRPPHHALQLPAGRARILRGRLRHGDISLRVS